MDIDKLYYGAGQPTLLSIVGVFTENPYADLRIEQQRGTYVVSLYVEGMLIASGQGARLIDAARDMVAEYMATDLMKGERWSQ